MIQPGGDLSWTRPADPESSGSLGNHTGPYEALNIKNAQPGMHYGYIRRDESQILRYQNMGWEPVLTTDPERFGARVPEHLRAELGTTRAFGDVLLMRIPIEKYEVLQRAKELKARAAREAPTQTFLDREAEVQAQLGARLNPRGSVVYSRLAGHQQRVTASLDG